MNDPLTLEQAAELLDLDPSTLRHQLRNGRLSGTKLGPIWTVSRAEVERYRAQHLGRFRARST